MSEKTLKQRIHSGEQIFGATVPMSINRSQLSAILDKGSYDFIWTDSQHTAFNEDRLVAFCEVANELDIPAYTRIKHTKNAYLIGNYLDLGLSGVQVPQVELESTVDEAVDSFYYPPAGSRSWGGVTRKGTDKRSDRVEYAKWWGEYGVLWLQIESVNAVNNARNLAKKGVDVLDFGPADLSFSLEANPHYPFRTVDDCVKHVSEQLKGTSVSVCFRNGTPDQRQKYAEMGVTVFLERPF